MKYRYDKRKPDSNQAQVVEELTQCGCTVWVISHCRKALDLIVGYRDVIYWVELKSDEKAKLTKAEKEILDKFRDNPHVIVGYSTEDILRKMGVMR